MLCLWLCVMGTVAAQDGAIVRYISDETAVTLREDKGMESEVMALIKSGARVELLESDEASGYSRVRVGPKREGWVLTRYLSDQPAAREKVVALEASLADQRAKLSILEQDNQRLRAAAAKAGTAGRVATTAGGGVAPRSAKQGYSPSDVMTGVGLFVVGLLVGLIASQLMRGRRRRRWTPEL